MLEGGLRLRPCTSFFPLQFGKCQQLWEVNIFYTFSWNTAVLLTVLPLFSALFLCEKPIKHRKVRFSKDCGAHAAHPICGCELPIGGWWMLLETLRFLLVPGWEVSSPGILPICSHCHLHHTERQRACSPLQHCSVSLCAGCKSWEIQAVAEMTCETNAAQPIICPSLCFSVQTAAATEPPSKDLPRGLKVLKLCGVLCLVIWPASMEGLKW